MEIFAIELPPHRVVHNHLGGGDLRWPGCPEFSLKSCTMENLTWRLRRATMHKRVNRKKSRRYWITLLSSCGVRVRLICHSHQRIMISSAHFFTALQKSPKWKQRLTPSKIHWRTKLLLFICGEAAESIVIVSLLNSMNKIIWNLKWSPGNEFNSMQESLRSSVSQLGWPRLQCRS